MTFRDFLREKFGPHWVVAQRLTDNMRQKGYTVAISPKRFDELEAEHERLFFAEARQIAMKYKSRFQIDLADALASLRENSH